MLILLVLVSGMTVWAQDDDDDATIIDVLDGLTVSAPLPDLGGVTIRVATMNAYPPFNDINSEGLGVGWDYDIMREMCSRLNCEPEFVEIEWEGLIPSVTDGTNDMAVNGITVTEPRKEVLDFSDPYITLRQVFLVRSNDDRFETVDDFVANEDLMLTALAASTNADTGISLLGEDSPRLTLSSETFDNMVLQLIDGTTDGIVMDDLTAQRYVNDAPDAFRIVESPDTPVEELAFIFTPGSELREAFNLGLAQIREDGTLEQINAQWLYGE